MRRLLRTVLACVLLAAVPLQGYAAAGMLFCGTPIGAADSSHPHGHADPAHGADAHPHSPETGAADSADAGLHHVHGTCSVCATCCSAAALPSRAIAASVPVPHAAPFLDHSTLDSGHGPAGLERPPRLILA